MVAQAFALLCFVLLSSAQAASLVSPQTPESNELFKVADTNQDGFISVDESRKSYFEDIRSNFYHPTVDSNKDGVLSEAEFHGTFEMVDFDIVDANQDGVVTYDELVLALDRHPVYIFTFCDVDQDSKLNLAEYPCTLHFAAESYSKFIMIPEQVFRAADADGDGRVSEEEFAAIVLLKVSLAFASLYGDLDKDGYLNPREAGRFFDFFLQPDLDLEKVDTNHDGKVSLKEAWIALRPIAFQEASQVDQGPGLTLAGVKHFLEMDKIAHKRRHTWRMGLLQGVLGIGGFIVLGSFLARAPTPTKPEDIAAQRLLSSQGDEDDDDEVAVTTARDDKSDSVQRRRTKD